MNKVQKVEGFNILSWGLDLGGQNGNPHVSGMHAAGGIGGLLAMNDTKGNTNPADDRRLVYFYDANGNVGQLIDCTPGQYYGTTQARYEYYPFGGILVSAGAYRDLNPFRFSTKYRDSETNLYYYGYRYLIPRLGRWVSREPLGELASRSLYEAVRNNPLSWIDPDGRRPERPEGAQPTSQPGRAPARSALNLKSALYGMCDRECGCRCTCGPGGEPSSSRHRVAARARGESKDECLRACTRECRKEVDNLIKLFEQMKKGCTTAGSQPNCQQCSLRLRWLLDGFGSQFFDYDAIKLARRNLPANSAHRVFGMAPKSCQKTFYNVTGSTNNGHDDGQYRVWDLLLDFSQFNTNSDGVRFYCFAGGTACFSGPPDSPHANSEYWPVGPSIPHLPEDDPGSESQPCGPWPNVFGCGDE